MTLKDLCIIIVAQDIEDKMKYIKGNTQYIILKTNYGSAYTLRILRDIWKKRLKEIGIKHYKIESMFIKDKDNKQYIRIDKKGMKYFMNIIPKNSKIILNEND